jgi:hypothetical protein
MHKRCIIKKVATEKTVGEAGQRCIYRRHARKGGFVSRSLGSINSNEGGARWTTVTSRSWMTPALVFWELPGNGSPGGAVGASVKGRRMWSPTLCYRGLL